MTKSSWQKSYDGGWHKYAGPLFLSVKAPRHSMDSHKIHTKIVRPTLRNDTVRDSEAGKKKCDGWSLKLARDIAESYGYKLIKKE